MIATRLLHLHGCNGSAAACQQFITWVAAFECIPAAHANQPRASPNGQKQTSQKSVVVPIPPASKQHSNDNRETDNKPEEKKNRGTCA
jgi:hypothetical protein